MTTAPDAALTPAAARTPHPPAGASYLGAVLSLSLVALGVIGIRDGIVSAGWLHGSSWTRNAVGWIDGLTFAGWMIPAGIVAIVIGAIFTYLGLKPRRTTTSALAGRSSLNIDRSDVARVAVAAARTVPGVTDARATANGRTVAVRVNTTGRDSADVKAAVAKAAGAALSVLAKEPRVVVRTSTGGHS